MHENKIVTKKERDKYYELKKQELQNAFDKFIETDDMHHLRDVFNIMVVMFRCAGMNFNQIRKFLKAYNQQRFDKLLTLHQGACNILEGKNK